MSCSEWKEYKLEELCSIIDSLHKSPQYIESGYPMVRVKDMEEGFLKLNQTAYVTKEVYEEFTKKHKPQKGDMLFSRVGSYGITTFVDLDDDFCLGQNTVVLTSYNNKIINNKFFFYMMISNIVKEQIELLVTGSTQKTISMKSIKSIIIPVPSLEEQEKIANILSSLDDKIELNNKMNKTLEEMAQSIFKRWFVDFEFPNEDGEPYKSSGGEMVESELGMIPRGWEVVTLENICNFNSSSYSNKDNWEYINYLDTSNITKNKIDNIQRIDCINEKIPSRAKRKVKKNSIVYSTVRPNQLHYGIIKNPVENMIVSTGFATIDSKYDYIKNDFIYYWLTQSENTEKLQAIGETSTTTFPAIKPADIKKMKLVISDENTLREISNKLDKINLYINELREEEIILKEIRDTLLPKLMSGEIKF